MCRNNNEEWYKNGVLKFTWGIWQILTWALKSLKNCLMDSLCPKYIMVKRKSTEELSFMTWKIVAKFEEKLTCVLKNMRNLADFHLSTRVTKLGLWWDPFVQSRNCMSLKFSRGVLYVMAMTSNAKFEEEWTCHFEIDMRNMANFDSNTWKSKKIAL